MRPLSVRRHTSQSGFKGFWNQGSAQPRSMQLWIVRGLILAPSSSKRGSFPPGWSSPRLSQRVCACVGLTFLGVDRLVHCVVRSASSLLSTICAHRSPHHVADTKKEILAVPAPEYSGLCPSLTQVFDLVHSNFGLFFDGEAC